jgi:choline dehydrogenase-like flavoprotein
LSAHPGSLASFRLLSLAIFHRCFHQLSSPWRCSPFFGLSFAFVEACAAVGLPLNPDFNAGHQEGFGLNQVTRRNGRRCSAAVGYLPAAMARSNFTVLTDAAVERLILDGTRCTGIVFRRGGRAVTIAGPARGDCLRWRLQFAAAPHALRHRSSRAPSVAGY